MWSRTAGSTARAAPSLPCGRCSSQSRRPAQAGSVVETTYRSNWALRRFRLLTGPCPVSRGLQNAAATAPDRDPGERAQRRGAVLDQFHVGENPVRRKAVALPGAAAGGQVLQHRLQPVERAGEL